MFTMGLVKCVAILHKKRLLCKCAGSSQLNLLIQTGQLRVRVNTENVFLYANERSHYFTEAAIIVGYYRVFPDPC